MSEYISKQDAKAVVIHTLKAVRLAGHTGVVGMMFEEIDGLLPADVVEVVRCKDCKRWNSDYDYCEEYATEKGAGDFCSSGARKDLED